MIVVTLSFALEEEIDGDLILQRIEKAGWGGFMNGIGEGYSECPTCKGAGSIR